MDRDWELERQTYMVPDRYGSHVPTKADSVGLGISIVGMGTIAFFLSLSTTVFPELSKSPALGVITAFGVFLVLVGLVWSAAQFRTAQKYQATHNLYESQRRSLLGKRDPT